MFLGAVENGDVKSVEAFLDTDGVDFSAKNAYGMGATHIAADRGFEAIMRLFLATNHFDFNEATESDIVQSSSK